MTELMTLLTLILPWTMRMHWRPQPVNIRLLQTSVKVDQLLLALLVTTTGMTVTHTVITPSQLHLKPEGPPLA